MPVTIIDLVPNDGATDVIVTQSIVIVTDMAIDRVNAERNIFLVEEGSSLLSGPDSLLMDSYMDFYRLVRLDVHKNEVIRVKAKTLNQVAGPNFVSFFDPILPLSKNTSYRLIVGSSGDNGEIGLTSKTFDPAYTVATTIQGLLYTKVDPIDNITLVFDGTAILGSVVVTGAAPDYTVTIGIDPGVSTATDVEGYLTVELTFTAICTATIVDGAELQDAVTVSVTATRLYYPDAYVGTTDDTLNLLIVDDSGKQRIDWWYTSNPAIVTRSKLGPTVLMGAMTLGFIGEFNIGDLWRIDVFAHEILEETLQHTFVTGELEVSSITESVTTGLIEDELVLPLTSPLRVLSHIPTALAVEVKSNQIEITFSEDIDEATILVENFDILGVAALDICGLFDDMGSINFTAALKTGTTDTIVLTIL